METWRASNTHNLLSHLLLVLLLVYSTCISAKPAEMQEDGTKLYVSVDGVQEKLLDNVLGYLEIQQFHDKTAPSSARVRYMHRSAEKQIQSALQPFGYYRATISSKLEKTPQGWQAHYGINTGPAMTIGSLDLRILGAGRTDPKFKQALAKTTLRKDAILDQAAYEALKKRFQVLASERGYFDAQLKKSQIRIDLANYSAAINLYFDTGERYKLGQTDFKEAHDWIAPELLERFVEIEPGQAYEAADLQQLQGDLSNSDYYKQVEIQASPKSADDLVIPVKVKLQPQKPRKYTFGVGFGTDTGARVSAGVTGRRINRRGHHYNAGILVSQVKYGLAGEYIIPASDPRTDSFGLRASYEDEHSDTRHYKAVNIGGYYKYRDELWLKTYALDYRVERFEVEGNEPTSRLLIPSIDWTRTFPAELDKRIYAAHGTWLQLYLRGAHDAVISDTSFLQPLISAKWIHSFKNRSRVISRATLGTTWVDNFELLPTSLRYFSGGDRTIRGYKYAVIGPLGQNDAVLGGKHLTEVGLEYEVPISEKWSIASFVDYGDAFNDNPEYKTGLGLGLHWRSPIGPVRIDLGHALDQPPGNNLRLHLTIGPDL